MPPTPFFLALKWNFLWCLAHSEDRSASQDGREQDVTNLPLLSFTTNPGCQEKLLPSSSHPAAASGFCPSLVFRKHLRKPCGHPAGWGSWDSHSVTHPYTPNDEETLSFSSGSIINNILLFTQLYKNMSKAWSFNICAKQRLLHHIIRSAYMKQRHPQSFSTHNLNHSLL